MRKKSIVLIVNPKAGRCKGVKQLSGITQTIQEKGYLPIVLLTRKPGDARRFAYEHGDEVEVVCCVGGDGTFSEVVSGKHSTPIGYIPAGSTNDYASSLGLSLNLHVAASDAVDGFSQSFDIGMLNGQPFAYVAAFGMLAKVSYSAPQDLKNILGHFAYVLEGICDLHSLRTEAMAIIQGIINGFGPAIIAGYSASVKLNNLVITSFTTVGNGISNYTAQNLGARKPERVRQGFNAGFKMVWILSVPLVLLYFIGGRYLIPRIIE